jgi:plasmid stabilization system protein ParE
MEVLGAVRFYLDIDRNIGAEFAELYEAAIAQILQDPLACMIVSHKTRRKVLRKFPYSIFYRFDTDEVRIVAVSHHRRSPKYWRKRR